MALTVESDSFNHGERVPDEHAFGVPDGEGKAAAEGGNRSPHLRWSGAPEGTQSFVLIVYDPDVPADFADANQEGRTIAEDAPRQDFTHWLLVDISPDVTELPEGAGSQGIVAGGKPTGETEHGVTGSSSYTDSFAGDPEMGGTYGGYDGPFPPWNDERLHPTTSPSTRSTSPASASRATSGSTTFAPRSRATSSTRARSSASTRCTPTSSRPAAGGTGGDGVRASGGQRLRSTPGSSDSANAATSSTVASTSPRSTISTGECM